MDSKWAREGDSWDFNLYELDLAVARDSQDFDNSIKLCESKCTVVQQDDFHQRFLAERLSRLVCTALSKAGEATRLHAFVDDHLDLAPVRDTAIRGARESHDLAKAEKLARDGMNLSAQQGHLGIVDHYAMELVSILDTRGQPDAAIEFAVERTISTHSMNWYKEVMKRNGKAEKREATTDRILRDVVNTDGRFAAEICVLERRWEELHVLALKNQGIMRDHYQVLGKVYPATVSPWLEKNIRQSLRSAQSRTSYKQTASLVADLLRIAGKEQTETLVDDLVSTYSNRPAMIEELHKAIKQSRKG
jgi:hypothetical protein